MSFPLGGIQATLQEHYQDNGLCWLLQMSPLGEVAGKLGQQSGARLEAPHLVEFCSNAALKSHQLLDTDQGCFISYQGPVSRKQCAADFGSYRSCVLPLQLKTRLPCCS